MQIGHDLEVRQQRRWSRQAIQGRTPKLPVMQYGELGTVLRHGTPAFVADVVSRGFGIPGPESPSGWHRERGSRTNTVVHRAANRGGSCDDWGVAMNLSANGSPFAGRWWTPDRQEHAVGGRLLLRGDVWRLELMGPARPLGAEQVRATCPLDVVHGQIGTVDITLLDLVPGSWTTSGNNLPHTSSLGVNLLCVAATSSG